MRLSDRYVFSELVPPFVMATLAVLMMLVGNTLFALLEPMLRQKWPLEAVARILVFNIPTVLVLTLPAATALAVSLAVNRMARDNEVTVFRGTGQSLLRTFAPVVVFGALISVANIYVYDRVVPWAWREQQNVETYLDALTTNPVESGLTVRVENYTITFASAQKVSETKRRLNRVLLTEDAPPQAAQIPPGQAAPAVPNKPEYPIVTSAEWADYEAGVWTLHNVSYHRYNPDGTTLFDGVADEGTLTLKIDYGAMYQPPRSGQYDKYSFAELTTRANDARRFGQAKQANEFESERWFKLSLPLMGIVLALCAAPLSLRFARTGAFTGVLLSVILVGVSWNCVNVCRYFALGGQIPPLVAAWAPNVLFTIIGILLLRGRD